MYGLETLAALNHKADVEAKQPQPLPRAKTVAELIEPKEYDRRRFLCPFCHE